MKEYHLKKFLDGKLDISSNPDSLESTKTRWKLSEISL